MFKKCGVAISLGIMLGGNPTAIGENSISKSDSNIFNKSNKTEIDVLKISIGGIKMRMKEKDIIEKLGKPKSRTIKYDNVCYVAYLTTWKYDGLEIGGISQSNDFSKSQVHIIKASSSRYSTEKNVKVGDSMRKAQKAYSTSKFNSEMGKDENYLTYPNAAFGGLMFIGDKQMIIKEISLSDASC